MFTKAAHTRRNDPRSSSPRGVTTIDLVYFNAGGGHRSAASALETVIRQEGRPWEVRRVNLMNILDPKDVFRKTTGMDWEDIYNTRLARGWSMGLAQELKLLQALIRLSHRSMARRLRRHWRRTRPDMVVSLIPNFNRPMYEAVEQLRPRIPYVTILTDFADHPPHFWIEPRQAQHFICGTPRAASQARLLGVPAERIHSTSGMIVRPDFYEETPLDRRAERAKLKLDPDRPTGLVMFGGHGSRAMAGIARRLGDVQLIFVCGHNAALAERLSEMPARAPRVVLGFTSEIRHYMQLSDFFIGKPGPGSISEAVLKGLPVVVVRNTWTMPQERYNTDWVRENNVGVVLESFRFVDQGVREIIDRLDEFRASMSHVKNRAVFEIPDILERILHDDGTHTARYAQPRGLSVVE
jgi:UDP-N-acetylglucosamine:LPS N-acetylglucosamine transferase